MDRLPWTVASIEIRAYLNASPSIAEQAPIDVPEYLGSYFMYGSGLPRPAKAPTYLPPAFFPVTADLSLLGKADNNMLLVLVAVGQGGVEEINFDSLRISTLP